MFKIGLMTTPTLPLKCIQRSDKQKVLFLFLSGIVHQKTAQDISEKIMFQSLFWLGQRNTPGYKTKQNKNKLQTHSHTHPPLHLCLDIVQPFIKSHPVRGELQNRIDTFHNYWIAQ